MQERDAMTDAHREFERALRSSVSPTRARVDAVTAAFAAGRRSQRRQMRFWQAAAGIVLLAGAGSWLIPVVRNAATPPVGLPGTLASQTQSPSIAPLSDQSLWKLQQAMQENGFRDLPPANLPAPNALRMSDML